MESTFSLLVRRTSDLDEWSRSEITQICTQAHGVDFSPLFTLLPANGQHVIGCLGSEIIAHAVYTTRWAQPEGHPPLKTAYIDAVVTSVKAQNKGYGTRLMRKVASEIACEDYRLCALETDKPRFYTRLGWEIWRGPLAGRSENGLTPTPESQGHVLILRLPRTPGLDLNGLLTIENQGRIW